MSFVHLTGAEDVQRAASSIRSSAETMQQAARELGSALAQHQQFLDRWLTEFNAVLQDRPHD